MARDVERTFRFEVEHGSYYVGSPETVAQKIARTMPQVGVERFDLVYGTGGQITKRPSAGLSNFMVQK